MTSKNEDFQQPAEQIERFFRNVQRHMKIVRDPSAGKLTSSTQVPIADVKASANSATHTVDLAQDLSAADVDSQEKETKNGKQ